MILQSKKELRYIINQKLNSYRNNFKNASEEITNNILSLDEYKKADTILSYMALPDEAEINIDLISEKKQIFIPKVNREKITMDFFMYTKKTEKGAYNILEPAGDSELFNINTPEMYGNILILTPGRAFTWKGQRLGRGKGYYDKFLANIINNFNRKKVAIAGVCFVPQIVDSIPTDYFDIKMDFIITNK